MPLAQWGTQKLLQKKSLPPFIVQLDRAIREFNAMPSGLRARKKMLADAIYTLVRDGFEQHALKDPRLKKYRALVVDAAIEAKSESDRIDQLIANFALAAQREVASRQLPANLAAFVQQDLPQEPDLTPYLPAKYGVEPSYPHALSMPRDAGGELSAHAIAEMNALAKDEFYADLAAIQDITVETGGKSSDEIRELMDANKNLLSGKTLFPELATAAQGEDVDRRATTAQLGGASVRVYWDDSDPTAVDRVRLLDAAIAKIIAAGIQFPPVLRVYLPRDARSLRIEGDCVKEGEVKKPAVFRAPDLLFLPAHIVGNPKLEQGSAEGPYFLSTALDTTGLATTIHELGHFLHYQNNPSGFHLMHATVHAGSLPDLKAIETEVSQYAAKNPREFVADVFLGLVYGRRFSPAIMNRYAGLRGMPVPAALAPVGAAPALPALGSGATVVYASPATKRWHEAMQDASLDDRARQPFKAAAHRWRRVDLHRYNELKSLLDPPPAGAVFDDTYLSITLPYNYQVVREQHPAFGKKLEEFAREFVADADQLTPGGDRLSAKDIAGKAFNDPRWMRDTAREGARELREARRRFAQFDWATFDALFTTDDQAALAQELAALPAGERIAHLVGMDPGNLIVSESHGDVRAKSIILDNIDALVKAGVDTLYVEHFRRNDYGKLLKAYNRTRGRDTPLPPQLAQLLEALDRAHNPAAVWPNNLKGLVEVAHRRGLNVLGIDHSGALTRTGEGMEKRAARMNFVAAEAIKADVDAGKVKRFILLVGEAHVHTHERGDETQAVPGLAQLLETRAVKPGADGVQLLTEKTANRGLAVGVV